MPVLLTAPSALSAGIKQQTQMSKSLQALPPPSEEDVSEVTSAEGLPSSHHHHDPVHMHHRHPVPMARPMTAPSPYSTTPYALPSEAIFLKKHTVLPHLQGNVTMRTLMRSPERLKADDVKVTVSQRSPVCIVPVYCVKMAVKLVDAGVGSRVGATVFQTVHQYTSSLRLF